MQSPKWRTLFLKNILAVGENLPCANDDAEHEPVAEQGDDHDQAVDAHDKVVPGGKVVLDVSKAKLLLKCHKNF